MKLLAPLAFLLVFGFLASVAISMRSVWAVGEIDEIRTGSERYQIHLRGAPDLDWIEIYPSVGRMLRVGDSVRVYWQMMWTGRRTPDSSIEMLRRRDDERLEK